MSTTAVCATCGQVVAHTAPRGIDVIDEERRVRLVDGIRGGALTGEQRELLIDLVYAADAATYYGPAGAAISRAYLALLQASGAGGAS